MKNIDVENESSEVLEEKQIKNAIIDLLHNNDEVTYEAISNATGLSILCVKKHSESIQSMLAKLKKAHAAPNFKS